MEPIISPWIVYLIGITDDVKTLFAACAIVLFVIIIIMAVVFLLIIPAEQGSFDAIKHHSVRKAFKYCIVGAIVSMVIETFVPTGSTLYLMLVSENITEDNIKTLGGSGKEFVDYIFDKVEEIKDQSDKKDED